ncbi:MAG: NfeD family protein, partial [Myxococcota bacterium]
FGQRVLVVEAVSPHHEGRIRFGGTTWVARTVDEELRPGMYARIVTRDNLVWIVERDDELALPAGEDS